MGLRSPILIAGAGPVGLVAAARLLALGQKVVMLEKRGNVNQLSRASTLHPPTLAILDQLGLLSPILAQGVQVSAIHYRDQHGIQTRFDLGQLQAQTRFPFRLHLEQSILSQHILKSLSGHPGFALHLHTELLGVENLSDRVRVTTTNPGESTTQQIEGKFLIAADGATSRVRQSLGIKMDGHDYASPVLRIFLRRDLGDYLPDLVPLSYLLSGETSCSLLKMPHGWRAILRLDAATDQEVALDPVFQQAQLSRFLPVDHALFVNSSADLYRARKRIAERNKQGRVLLMGDAVHLTNTRGGMNMNCGIHDADAICQMLVKGSPEQLQHCAAERLRIARDLLLPRTDSRVTSVATWFQTVQEIAADGNKTEQFLVQSSMLDMVNTL